jgi:hypothetical protein
MGLFSFFFGKKDQKAIHKPSSSGKKATNAVEETSAGPEAIHPEIAAIIAAAAYTMLAAEAPGISFKINRISREWAAAGREKIMDSHSVPPNFKRRF